MQANDGGRRSFITHNPAPDAAPPTANMTGGFTVGVGDGVIPGYKPGKPERRYLPTLADLVDRLCIVQLKMVFLSEFREEYLAERALILHDIDLILKESPPITAKAIMAITILQLSNRCIWESESKARAGGNEQDQLLKMTHSINGVRNTAKNILSGELGGRKDYKIDALAADLPPEYGHWRVFE